MLLFRAIALLAVLGFASVSLTACNTMSGAGKDIKAGGEAVHDTAEDTKDNM